MRNSLLITMREIKERLGARSFIFFSIFGPLVVLGLVYLMFVMGGQQTEKWNVLVADPAGILQSKINPQEDPSVTFSFANGYIEHTEFANAKKFQQYDALVEVNEKILSNKSAHVFYRTKPAFNLQAKVQHNVERRIEEVMIGQFTELSVAKFREIKQPITFSFRNVYDPYDQSSDIRAWVGLFFGLVILVFIALFGMTVLRSVSKEKSNRIIEVLLASVKPSQLMTGKIAGIGFSAFVRFVIWIVVIGVGLFVMRENLFPSMYDASQLTDTGISGDLTIQEQLYNGKSYNAIVDLVYERIHFDVMLFYFLLFFIGGYLFYAAFFAGIGAAQGTESDGQQFVLPVLLILSLSGYAGYFVLMNPDSELAIWMQYIPFTAPVVLMVKLAMGFEPGESWQLIASLMSLFVSAALMLWLAGRIYKNGILQFGHRLRLKHILRWLR